MYAGYLANLHNLKVLILEASIDQGGQMKLFLDKPVYDMPGHLNIDGRKIMNLIFKQLKNNPNTTIYYDSEVKEIKGSIGNFNVVTSSKIFDSKTVIIASGGGLFKPIKLGIKDEEKYKNIKYSISDSKKYLDKKILILGGGDTSIDWTHYYFKRKTDVVLIHRRNTFRGQEKLLDEMRDKIKIYTPFKVKEIIGKKNVDVLKIENVKNKEVKEINCDFVFVFLDSKKLY